jgi:hypothetical protein
MRISIVRSGSKSIMLVGLAACGGPDEDVPVDCSKVTNVDTFVVGLEHPGMAGRYNFRLMSADPAPPARGDNTWVVQVNSLNAGVVGTPVTGATLRVTPFMPEHGHGTAVPIEITPMTEPGQYQATPVNMWMEGVWETTIRATVGADTDSAVFKFCLP